MENPLQINNIFRKIHDGSIGLFSHQQLANQWIRERWLSIDLCDHCKLNSPHKAPILATDCERIENRYVLCGDRSGQISLFDCYPAITASYAGSLSKPSTTSDSNSNEDELDFEDIDVSVEPSNIVLKPLHKTLSCKSAIRTLQWYTVDTGMFFSGGMDGNVHCWNTNTMRIAHTFALGDFIYDSHMSDVSSTTSVLAVATKSTQVRLCDVRSGAFSHTLIGHKEEVTAVRWSPIHEYSLATGSKDTVSYIFYCFARATFIPKVPRILLTLC
jgi:DNA excision repair protein ERCC-8